MSDGEARWCDLVAFVRAFAGFARWRLAFAIVLMCLGAVFEGVGLFLLVPLIGLMTMSRDGLEGRLTNWLASMFSGEGRDIWIAVVLGGFLALMSIRAIVLILRDRTIGGLHIRWPESVREGLIAALARADWPRVSRLSRARILQALGPEIDQLSASADALLQVVLAAILLICLFVLATILAPVAGPLSLLLLAGGGMASRSYLRKAHAFGHAIIAAHLGMTGRAMRFLDGLKLAVAEGEQERFAARFVQISARAKDDRLANIAAQSNLRHLSSAIAALIAAIALFIGLVEFRTAPSAMVALLIVLARSIGPALTLQQFLQRLFNNLPAHAAIRGLLNVLDPDCASPRSRRVRIAGGCDAIMVSNVSFWHDGGQGAVENIDLAIPLGSFVGVSGPSGAGKTTFLDLVAGILEPTQGSLQVPDVVNENRSGIAYIGQDAVIFEGTVRDNLTWSRPDASDAEIWASLRLARAEPLVRGLDNGLEAQVGERGILLSAGERQRLALARALLRRPSLLILDEATNAIDIPTEALIIDGLADLPDRPTILMAAHRSESFRRCEMIVHFSAGIVERIDREVLGAVTLGRNCPHRP